MAVKVTITDLQTKVVWQHQWNGTKVPTEKEIFKTFDKMVGHYPMTHAVFNTLRRMTAYLIHHHPSNTMDLSNGYRLTKEIV